MYKKVSVMVYDLLIVLVSFIGATFIRLDFSYSRFLEYSPLLDSIPVIITVYFIVFLVVKTNRTIWSRVSIDEAIKIFLSNIFALLILLVCTLTPILNDFSKSIIVIGFLINTLTQTTSRFLYRFFMFLNFRFSKKNSDFAERVIIYGAGASGGLILKEILQNSKYNWQVIGMIDDNTNLVGKKIFGVKVLGTGADLSFFVSKYRIQRIIVAMPGESLDRQKAVMQTAFKTKVQVLSVTSSENLLSGQPLKNSLQQVDILDLLERKEIVIDDNDLFTTLRDKNVLVTGAAGSIGSELVRQIMKYGPREVTLFDIHENGLYALQQEINRGVSDGLYPSNSKLSVLVGSIRDGKRVKLLFEKGGFEIVFHAAAHKHVPLMEDSPAEAVKNNILGTWNLIKSANEYKVTKFINISTDKAVNPTNVMGASKRFIELMLLSQEGKFTKFVAVRFGNVLGSNGSVVPLFKKQIENGGPVTVTHPDIVRYFMTIPEAVSLVLQAASYANGGEIFVLDMGSQVKIYDLAVKIIKLSGFEPNKDIEIIFTGLRPGEKLFEELLMDEEGMTKTDNQLIYIEKPHTIKENDVLEWISQLEVAIQSQSDSVIRDCLKKVVPTYVEPGEVGLSEVKQ